MQGNRKYDLQTFDPKHRLALDDRPVSQIDVAPTILGLLNFNYTSEFYGRDILQDGVRDPHIFLANYQTIGFLDGDFLTELRPNQAARVVNPYTYEDVPPDPESDHAMKEGIAFFQTAAHEFSVQQLEDHGNRFSPIVASHLRPWLSAIEPFRDRM